MGHIFSICSTDSVDDGDDNLLKEVSDALYWAAQAGDLSQCESLLARGANVNHVRGVYNRTPLHTASLNGRTSVVELLIEHGADIEAKDRTGFTPLHCAAQEGHLAITQLLVTRGARTDAVNEYGVMPIHKAAQYNRHLVLEFLVTEAEVSVNVVSVANVE